MDVETEISPMVKKVLESKEFKRAVMDIVADTNIPADNVEDLDSAVESVINNGSFEISSDISFSA